MKKIIVIGHSFDHHRALAGLHLAAAMSKGEIALRSLSEAVRDIPKGYPDWSAMVHEYDPTKMVTIKKSASNGFTEGPGSFLPDIQYNPDWKGFNEKRIERWRLHQIRLKFAINRKRRKSKRK